MPPRRAARLYRGFRSLWRKCLHLALERQPRVAAARGSLAAAQAAEEAVASLRLPSFLAPDLPIRRQQAALGVAAAAAALAQDEWDAAYAVKRNWFSVLYALEQARVTTGVVDGLTTTNQIAREMLQEGAATFRRRTLIEAWFTCALPRRGRSRRKRARSAP